VLAPSFCGGVPLLQLAGMTQVAGPLPPPILPMLEPAGHAEIGCGGVVGV
jgi:hypothetical protein